MAHLLYDLLKSDLHPAPKFFIIFDSLHWHLKKIFRDATLVQEVNDKISNFNEDRIPYEKESSDESIRLCKIKSNR